MTLEGTWKITQHWDGTRPYSFYAHFGGDGTIDLDGFFGTWTVLGNSNQVALAITNSNSVTSYAGNVVGGAMGGQMTGRAGSRVSRGVWSAVIQAHAEAEERAYMEPGEG